MSGDPLLRVVLQVGFALLIVGHFALTHWPTHERPPGIAGPDDGRAPFVEKAGRPSVPTAGGQTTTLTYSSTSPPIWDPRKETCATIEAGGEPEKVFCSSRDGSLVHTWVRE